MNKINLHCARQRSGHTKNVIVHIALCNFVKFHFVWPQVDWWKKRPVSGTEKSTLWIPEADVVTKKFMMPLHSLCCDVTAVVICCDITVLFTICLSLERGGFSLISTTACCPTGHEVEWPLGLNREECNLLMRKGCNMCVCVCTSLKCFCK